MLSLCWPLSMTTGEHQYKEPNCHKNLDQLQNTLDCHRPLTVIGNCLDALKICRSSATLHLYWVYHTSNNNAIPDKSTLFSIALESYRYLGWPGVYNPIILIHIIGIPWVFYCLLLLLGCVVSRDLFNSMKWGLSWGSRGKAIYS